MVIWSIITITVLVLYAITILSFALSWRFTKTFTTPGNLPQHQISISVIIAVRNEENNLSDLVNVLASQELSGINMETILVDDHSTDNSPMLIKQLCDIYSWLKLVELPANSSGKKAALKEGAKLAAGELLCFTDSDCRPGPNWLKTTADFYHSKNYPDLIIGLVDAKSHSVMERIFRLEFVSLVLSGAGAWSLKTPIFCNGANLAVKASVYKEYNPNTNIVSGDDVFLLHHVKNLKGNIQLIKSKDHIVFTQTAVSLKDFINQRRRWASKTIYYTDTLTLFIALLVFFSNALIVLSMFLSIWLKSYYLLAIAYGLKTAPDYALFYSGKKLLQLKGLVWLVPIIELFYPFYIVITTITSIKKPFEWKGRKQHI